MTSHFHSTIMLYFCYSFIHVYIYVKSVKKWYIFIFSPYFVLPKYTKMYENCKVIDLGVTNCRVVESVGEHVEGFAAGDPVVPTFLGQCTECVDCASERSNVCSTYRFAVRPGMPRDGTARFRDRHGAPIHHFLGVSSFSEYTVVDANQVVRVDPAVPPATASLLSCGATTGSSY